MTYDTLFVYGQDIEEFRNHTIEPPQPNLMVRWRQATFEALGFKGIIHLMQGFEICDFISPDLYETSSIILNLNRQALKCQPLPSSTAQLI